MRFWGSELFTVLQSVGCLRHNPSCESCLLDKNYTKAFQLKLGLCPCNPGSLAVCFQQWWHLRWACWWTVPGNVDKLTCLSMKENMNTLVLQLDVNNKYPCPTLCFHFFYFITFSTFDFNALVTSIFQVSGGILAQNEPQRSPDISLCHYDLHSFDQLWQFLLTVRIPL